jgi:hypothetical protein
MAERRAQDDPSHETCRLVSETATVFAPSRTATYTCRMDSDIVTTPDTAPLEAIEEILPVELVVGTVEDEIFGAAALSPTRFTAEEWKRRALYENDRRVHLEQELLRIRDDIDRVIRRTAILPGDPSH